MEDNKVSEKEKRIRAITKMYYSNPKIQEAMVRFGQDREVVPRYFEGFGKRPDTIQYPSDIMALANKGATSFHASEEIWNDPLKINSEMSLEELNGNRKSWDLLIDIDSPFLDFSKIAARMLINELKKYGISSYGIKFSGSKGFHIIIPGKCFPNELNGIRMKDAFPEWPKAICEYLKEEIKPLFSKEAQSISNMSALEIRTSKKAEQLMNTTCPQCNKPVIKDTWITLRCGYCLNEVRQKKSVIAKKRVLRCEKCLGIMNVENEEEFFECKDCKITNISKTGDSKSVNIKYTKDSSISDVAEMSKNLHEEYTGGFDLVLVASRHLFRMPYSLHEKTALASIILNEDELENFSLKDANPMNIKIREYYPEGREDEAKKLLIDALAWKKSRQGEEDKKEKKYEVGEYEKIDIKDVTDNMFPAPIKKLLKGLTDGKKRGLFILLTFLKCANFSPEEIDKRVKEWNKLNKPPLKEGYVRSQVEWHLKQKKKILPPNYDNESFYKDLGLLDKKPEVKIPLWRLLEK